jgi:hypothetical protein
MADTRFKIATPDNTYDQDEAPAATVRMTYGMRRRITKLCELGIYGTTVEEVCERLICRQLQEMESRSF